MSESRTLDRMRAKSGGADIPVTLGDFAQVTVDGDYALIYVVFLRTNVADTALADAEALANQSSSLMLTSVHARTMLFSNSGDAREK
jgi:hypothetical protein